jgi:hypothetical protein
MIAARVESQLIAMVCGRQRSVYVCSSARWGSAYRSTLPFKDET